MIDRLLDWVRQYRTLRVLGVGRASAWKAYIRARRDLERVQALYDDLILQVGNVYPGESRHETARRYLQAAERGDDRAMQEGP